MERLLRASVTDARRNELTDLDASGSGPRVALLAAWSRASADAPADAEALALRIAAMVEPDTRAVSAFDHLASRFRVAIVSNGSSASQRLKLQRSGLPGAPLFFVSEELGVAKPAPAPFLTALRALEVRAEDALFVGDDPESDIAGAAAVGMATCWVARGRTSAHPTADLIVDHVGELPAVLEGIGKPCN